MADVPGEKRWLLTVNGAILEAIGRITVHFAHLEQEVDMLIWSLIAGFDAISAAPDADAARRSFDAQRVGQAVTSRLLLRSKMEIMLALGTERLRGRPEFMEAIQTVCKGLDVAAEKRNRIVHAVWSGEGGGAGAVPPGVAVAAQSRLVHGAGMRQRVSVHAQEELSELADVVAQLGYSLSQLRAVLFTAPGEEKGPAA